MESHSPLKELQTAVPPLFLLSPVGSRTLRALRRHGPALPLTATPRPVAGLCLPGVFCWWLRGREP